MRAFMERLYSYILLLVVFLSMAGCQSLLQESRENSVDADVLATYFDGPKVRPGVALAISVTATGTQGQAAKQYFVDADGYIAMELVGQIKCDGLTLVGLQQKITAAYKEFFLDPHVTATFIYQAGGGMVSATVNGKHELMNLEINPEAVDPDDVEMLQDMVIAAVNEALRAADAEAANNMSRLTGGLNLGGLF